MEPEEVSIETIAARISIAHDIIAVYAPHMSPGELIGVLILAIGIIENISESPTSQEERLDTIKDNLSKITELFAKNKNMIDYDQLGVIDPS